MRSGFAILLWNDRCYPLLLLDHNGEGFSKCSTTESVTFAGVFTCVALIDIGDLQLIEVVELLLMISAFGL